MTTYRTGSHHGVTIVAEGDGVICDRIGHDCTGRGHLVAVVVNGDLALAERICIGLNRTPTDRGRFEVAPVGSYGYEARIAIHCDRCGWEAGLDYEESLTLAELNQRADEHAEVCR